MRIYLEKVREETESELLEQVRRRADQVVGADTVEQVEFMVIFGVTRCLNLVGPGSPE